MRTCPCCAEAIQDAAIVCKHCGRDISATRAHTPQRRWAKRLGLVIAVVAALFVVGFFLEVGRSANAPPPPSTNAIHSLLLRDADPAQRLGVIVREHHDACTHPTQGFFQGAHTDGGAFWDVHCVGDRDYIVEVRPDDSTETFPCGETTERLMKVPCFQKF